MPNILHRSLPDAELHEPKGVVRAPAGAVYRASGNGTGQWTKITPTMLQNVAGNGAKGQYVTLDGEGGFAIAPVGAFASGRCTVAPAATSNIVWTSAGSGALEVANLITTNDSRFGFSVTGFYECNFHFAPITGTDMELKSPVNFIRSDGQYIQQINQRIYENAISFIGQFNAGTSLTLILGSSVMSRAPYFDYSITKVG